METVVSKGSVIDHRYPESIIETGDLGEVRCPNCNKLVFKSDDPGLIYQARCPRCKTKFGQLTPVHCSFCRNTICMTSAKKGAVIEVKCDNCKQITKSMQL